MAHTQDIKHYLAYPLRWVLLWAIMPAGYEPAAHSCLVKGAVAEVAPGLPPAGGEQEDALVKQQAFRSVIRSFTLPLGEAPAFRRHFRVAALLASILPVTILPNAP